MLPTVLRGARTHNLRGVDLDLRAGEVVAIVGVSGAGKSSLAMDTLYAEAQRRFVESFSPYARQFLERLERPPTERLEPVPAGVAIDRRAPIKSSRSTVATMADLEAYFAALFVREARPVCPEHQVPTEPCDAGSAAERTLSAMGEDSATVTYPVRIGGIEPYLELRDSLIRDGFRRLWLGGEAVDIDRVAPSRALASPGGVEVVVDRLRTTRAEQKRLTSSLEQAFRRSSGIAKVHGPTHELVFQEGLSCPVCGHAFDPPRPGLFSYSSPLGACPTCRGFGRVLGIDLGRVVPDPTRTLKQRAIRPWRGSSTRWERSELNKLCARHKIPFDRPWQELAAAQQELVLDGDGPWEKGTFPGVRGWFTWLETRTYKLHVRVLLSRYRSYDECPECHGHRLNRDALAYRAGGIDLATWHGLEIRDALARVEKLRTRTAQGELVRRELLSRLGYLTRVGVGYLTLDRQARTLSGGEAQRVTLTAALGTSLHSALFVLDEPTVGLHPTDVEPLNAMLRELAERGNTVLVVEHDPSVIRAADRVVELGPGAGEHGGRIVADGTPGELARLGGATGRALRGAVAGGRVRRKPRSTLSVVGARAHNLQNVQVELPLGVLCAVTGPSGSGKSTLAVDIVYRALARRLGDLDVEAPGAHDALEGAEAIRQVVLVDQSPLGRTSRGNAATYTKAWDAIRQRFAREPAAAALGLGAAHFSFNVAAGRCEACAGEGFETVEMQFLADVHLVCPSCRGRRFTGQVLSVKHRGLDVATLLEKTVTETLALFADDPRIVRALGPVARLGLGYVRIGQPLSALSGGEAQRLKLARALGERHAGTLFVLDEPSAGLHADEIGALVGALDAIIQGQGSVVVVDHDLDLVRAADYVVDLGPGAGTDGGQIVAAGTPEELARTETRTGQALREFGRAPMRSRPRSRPTSDGKFALTVTRAREHNLRDVSVSIPHGSLTVITGPSGSGKSTLGFDVVFAEGQRRFLETLTPYARQFLPTMPRPDVDAVVGVPPSVALEQRTSRAGSRSTLATVTEVAHYLRLLYAKLGVPHCPEHDVPIQNTSIDQVYEAMGAERGQRTLLAPAVVARKGTYLDLFNQAAREGIQAALCDGVLVSTDDPPRLAKTREHNIDLLIARDLSPRRITRELVEQAMRWGQGALKLRAPDGSERLFSARSSCPACGLAVPELDPRFFSFSTKQGKCPRCEGEGVLTEERRTRRGRKIERRVVSRVCPACQGTRLHPLPRAVRLQGERYPELVALSVERALARVHAWRFSPAERKVAAPIVHELSRRLSFLLDVGLAYLSLDRDARSLSGGEMQRLRLGAQLGAGLTGALYVLDEPTIGLHARDTERLLRNLRSLVDLGSTVIVIEHDADTIRAADYLVDLGPGGGANGGHLMAAGPPSEVLDKPESPTGRALSAPIRLRPSLSVKKDHDSIVLEGARQHNLKDVTFKVPVGRFTVVAGVSGSGKSTLVRQVLLPAVRQGLGLVTEAPGAFRSLEGEEHLSRALAVDQSPIGRTPRSVPATFLGIWDEIRQLFAATPDAQVAGFNAARFSFNVAKGGRCTHCEGQGVVTHEMSFLPDVTTPCPECGGLRFEPQTLAIRYLGRSAGDILRLTAEEAQLVFSHHPRIAQPLKTLTDLGAGYIALGQGSHTLSGGEAQRLKLAAELTATARHEPTLYVLDEPTTGLHLTDVYKLMEVLGRLVERGDTLVVIEHHPVVVAGADWVVELGPEGGEKGGRVVAQGSPREMAKRATATGRVVKGIRERAE